MNQLTVKAGLAVNDVNGYTIPISCVVSSTNYESRTMNFILTIKVSLATFGNYKVAIDSFIDDEI
jgi:hypothetical protein